jgi:hypothetical protein
MRQIYLLAMDADAAAAGEVEQLLKQRGYMVRRAEEKSGFPPARVQEVTLALWSGSAQLSSKHILFTNRAIDAWTEGRLIFARLDHTLLPRGLSDISAIDLSFAPARIAATWKIVEAAQEIDRAIELRRYEDTEPQSGGPGAPQEEPLPVRQARPSLTRMRFSTGAAVIVGLVAAGAFGSMGFIWMPFASNFLVGLAALAWGALAGAVAGYIAGERVTDALEDTTGATAPAAKASATGGQHEAMRAREPEPANESGPAPVFVSYARQNGEIVYPLVAEVEAAGRPVWIDRDEIKAGGNWAGMIVRAIRESDTFCLMCSAEAFQSDNVRREIYIADKYKRKLLPVRLDSAEIPEDFEYFLIDRQWLDLAGIPPDERAARLKAILVR